MAWLRLDDHFLEHPKVVGLTDRQLRVHLAVMLYCQRYQTGGAIPRTALSHLGATPATVSRFLELALWDEQDGLLRVHDFDRYNPRDPTNAARQKRYREALRNGQSNAPVTEPVTSDVTVLARAGTRARSPSPSPSPKEKTQALPVSQYDRQRPESSIHKNIPRPEPGTP